MLLASIVRSLALVTALLFVLSPFEARPVPGENPTFVRLVDASPDAGLTDMFVDGKELVSNFQFGTVTRYATVPPGYHRWQMAAIGKGPAAAVVTQVILCDPGEPYTIAAYGTKATGIKLGLFSDDNELVRGKTKVRVYHFAPDVGSIRVLADAVPIAVGLAYSGASRYTTLSSSAYTLHVLRQDGSTATSQVQRLGPDTVASIFLIGMGQANPQLQLVVSQEAGMPALPDTGSDPHERTQEASPPWMWFAPVALIALLGAGVLSVAVRKGQGRLRRGE
jgi:Domain of unknown function (DUF4397)